MNKLRALFKQQKASKVFAAAALATIVLVVMSHAWNMFGYPYYENDEATYISRAFNFANEGELDVYTYRYDHAPLGWMLMSAWLLLTGEDRLFPSLLVSGRVFMFLLFLACTYMVYVLTKRVTSGNRMAALAAALLFSLSPLAIYFHRRILLDNIMTFWVMLSLILATQPKAKLRNFILSALTFGVAVLTKLNAIFFLPAFLYIIWKKAHPAHRLQAGLYWLAITGFVVISFFIYAMLKGELLPAPIGPDGQPTRVSVVDTFALQLGRGDFAYPWLPNSSFMQNVMVWGYQDWTILAAGLVATIVLTVIGFKQRKKQPLLLGLALIVWCMLAFLARGKLVLNLYIIPLLPFFALAFGVVISVLQTWKPRMEWLKRGTLGLVIVATATSLVLARPQKSYTHNEVSNQVAAMEWVQKNIPKDAVIATDNYLYPYLAQENDYSRVSYFFSTEYDPEIRDVYGDDWRNIEYLVLTHEVVEQIETGTVPNMKQLFDHSVLLADFTKDTTSYIDLRNYISTNGDWVQVYKVKDRNAIVLEDSWQHFKNKFIVDYGQVVDPQQNNMTTSSGQAHAMLRAVEEDDRNTFSGTWQWSKDHLQYRLNDKLLSHVWEKDAAGIYSTTNTNASCDANQQMAYALLQAGKKWKSNKYTRDGETLARDWWSKCVIDRNGTLYVAAFADGAADLRPIDTATFNPVIYRYMATQMPGLQWTKLTADGYATYQTIVQQNGTVPNWFLLAADGSLISAGGTIDVTDTAFGRHSADLISNLAHDYHGSRSEQAVAIITALRPTLATYAQTDPGPQVQTAVALTDQIIAKASAQKTYESRIAGTYKQGRGYWDNGDVYDTQFHFWKWHHVQRSVDKDLSVKLR